MGSKSHALDWFIETATKGLGEQKASDSTEGKDHDDHRKTLFPLTSSLTNGLALIYVYKKNGKDYVTTTSLHRLRWTHQPTPVSLLYH
ncbi:hypothetical protein YC2023_074342 [Brassica napus]